MSLQAKLHECFSKMAEGHNDLAQATDSVVSIGHRKCRDACEAMCEYIGKSADDELSKVSSVMRSDMPSASFIRAVPRDGAPPVPSATTIADMPEDFQKLTRPLEG